MAKIDVRDQVLSIGELAERAETPATTIRFYEREGLMPEPDRVGGQRRYQPEAVQRLAAINLAKSAGFSLREIGQFVRGFAPSTPPSARWRMMASVKLEQLDRQAAEIGRMRSVLRSGLECNCLTLDECQLLPE